MGTRTADRRPLVLLGSAVVAYALAAWTVAPGFYDGFAAPQAYRWASPPPHLRSSNQPALPGHGAVDVGTGGQVLPGSVFTQDLQASLAFVQGAFAAPPDRSPVTIDIRPQTSFPDPGTMHLATNVYCVTASEPVVAGRELLVTLEYSNQLPAPSDVYTYQGSGPWQRIGQTGSAVPFSVSARTASLGCFAGGYVTGSAQGPRLGGGQTLPIVVALAILIVVLAGIPLAVLRRRDAGGDADPEEQ